MVEPYCFPVCKACRDPQVICPKASQIVNVAESSNFSARTWRPNMLRGIPLPCGHSDIPWPIWHKLGDSFVSIFCSECNEMIKLSKTYKAECKRKAVKLAKAYAERVRAANTKTVQEMMVYDRPPF